MYPIIHPTAPPPQKRAASLFLPTTQRCRGKGLETEPTYLTGNVRATYYLYSIY